VSAAAVSYRAAERLAHALMFEGYVLYPYRRSSLKNMQRFSFGTLQLPSCCTPGTSDTSRLRLECLVRGSAPAVDVSARFLQYVRRVDLNPGEAEPWIEALERSCSRDALGVSAPCVYSFERTCPGEHDSDAHSMRTSDELRVQITLAVARLEPGLFKLCIDVANTSEGEDALLGALGSVHVLLRAQGGRFVSLLEPPSELAQYAASCQSRGCFPVLVGPAERDDVMLASPIILYDRPAIAPESAGDFCDATEIDEMLTLRVLTLTEDERREALRTDAKSRAILERTFAQDEAAQLALHGTHRAPLQDEQTLEPPRTSHARSRMFAPGDAVRLHPKKGGDVFDLALRGERATIASIEEDFEGRVHYAVTVDADPGRDLGADGMPGHRFFFAADELERIV
jgi:hydrogenase maturation protease